MQTVSLYIYSQYITIFYSATAGVVNQGNDIVYQTTIQLHKGINNPVKFIFKNRDQKRIDITGDMFVADIIDATNNTIAKRYNVTIVNAADGIGQITVLAADIENFKHRFYHLVVRNSNDTPVFSDDNFSARIPIQLNDGYPSI